MPVRRVDLSEEQKRERKREQTALRMRRLRERQREADGALPVIANPEQLAQGEMVIDLGSTAVDAAIPTDPSLGIRVELDPRVIDEDEVLAQLGAVSINDTALLYGTAPPRRRAVFDWEPPRDTYGPSFDSVSDEEGPLAGHEESGPTYIDADGLDDIAPAPAPPTVTVSFDTNYHDDSGNESETIFHDAPESGLADSPPPQITVDATSPHSEHALVAEELTQDNPPPPSTPTLEDITNGVVEKLIRLLSPDLPQCSADEHASAQAQHNEACHHQHHPLTQINQDLPFPYVLSTREPLTPHQLSTLPSPTVSEWEELYCGLPPGYKARPARHVCLHAETTSPTPAPISYDIDSLLGFATSLAFARQGMSLTFAPQMRHNITADIHITTQLHIEGYDEPQPVLLRDIPHFQIGRLSDSPTVAVYIFLPQQYLDKEFNALSSDTLERFYNEIYLPVLHERLPAHVLQHLPASYKNGLAESRARQVEDRRVDSGSYNSQQQIVYEIQPEDLVGLWEAMVDRTQRPGLFDFQDMQIFFAAKNLKLRYKSHLSRPTLEDTMQRFETRFTEAVDLDHVDLNRFFVDVGQEICAEVSELAQTPLAATQEPQVWLWKRCCLTRIITWLYDGEPPAPDTDGHRYYTTNMLYEASALTSTPSKNSHIHAAGVRYSQFYGSVKEMVDAAKCFPFNNEGLEELTLDPNLRRGANSVLRGRRTESRILRQAYAASKLRTHDALRDAANKSFGLRQEHRISWDLFQRMRARLAASATPATPHTLEQAPPYCWAIRSPIYLDFLARSANKFAVGFEMALARCNPVAYSWEQTKILIMFLRCLRYVFGGHLLRRESALWWSHRVSEDAQGRPIHRYGLGFEHTLKQYGYGWIEPRIDWTRLQFRDDITEEVLFGNRVLSSEYRKHGMLAHMMFDFSKQNDMALQTLRNRNITNSTRERMFHWLAHVVLRQFRIDVITTLKKDVRVEFLEEAMGGLSPLTDAFLERAMKPNTRRHFVSGNRCGAKPPDRMRQLFFGPDNDGEIRTHWIDKPWRALHKRILAMLGNELADRRQYQVTLYALFDQFHFVLPYPHPLGLMQTDKSSSRMWYSVVVKGGMRVWGRNQAHTFAAGTEPKLPHWLLWTRTNWKTWLQTRTGPNEVIVIDDDAE